MSAGTTAITGGAFRWATDLWELTSPSPNRVVVADSWLVDAGTVLALDVHRERFVSSVQRQGGDSEVAAAAFSSMHVLVPESGRWFPRIDFTPAGFQCIVRPAPPISLTARVVTASHDPRQSPRIKGPDLALCLDERAAAEARGANEAIITVDGWVVDGTTSALLWWRDGALCVPPPTFPRVASVTARSTLAIAQALGVRIVEERARPDDLAGCEVWVASALHGIRGVTSWIGGPEVAEPRRAPQWQTRLRTLRARAW